MRKERHIRNRGPEDSALSTGFSIIWRRAYRKLCLSPSIQVPDWQRSYSWDNPRVEIFWNDLLNFSNRYPDKNITDQEYFLGALVIVDAGGKQLLLDGQQRLATATILLSVIRDFLKEYKADAASRVQQRYIADIDDATNTTNHKLTMNRYD